MKFFKKFFKRTRNVFMLKESCIQFHGEPSGEVENKIKELWRNSLTKFDKVEEAYLTSTQLNSTELPHPTLCIYPKCPKSKRLVEKLSNDFKSLFASKEYVDIIFLTKKTRNECQDKCTSFYKKKVLSTTNKRAYPIRKRRLIFTARRMVHHNLPVAT